MRLESALNSSREGLFAHGQALAIVGDNVANASTTGYKSSRAEFADLYAEGGQGRESEVFDAGGNGVKVAEVRQIHEGGLVEPTGRPLDVGIEGNGFFVVGEVANPSYTRAGNFIVGQDGLLKTSAGQNVLGFTGNDTTTLGALNMVNLNTVGTPTTAASLFGNLSADADVTTPPTNPTSFRDIAGTAAFVTGMTVYDSLGSAHDVTMAFYKTGPNAWTGQAYLDAKDTGGTPGTPVQLGQNANFTFSNAGLIEEANKAQASITATPAYSNGAAAGNFTINFGGMSQFAANTSQLSSITQDGKGVGSIKGYEIRKDGSIFATLDSGTFVKVGAIGLADFNNVEGLQRSGNSLWTAGPDTGTPNVGIGGTGRLGAVQGGALERSTVDISAQFVDLIVYQRGYQANSQTLNAANGLIRDTIQLIR